MHDRGVVAAAEPLADPGQRQIGELSTEIHGDVAGVHQGAVALHRQDLRGVEPEVPGGLGQDQVGGDGPQLPLGIEVLEDVLGQLYRNSGAVEARECDDTDECALQLSNVGLDTGGDEGQNIVGEVAGAFKVGLFAKNGDTRLEVGRLDVGNQAAAKP